MPNGLRWLIINGLSRQQLEKFIKQKDNSFDKKNLSNYSDTTLRKVAYKIDSQAIPKKKNISSSRKKTFLSKEASARHTAGKEYRIE